MRTHPELREPAAKASPDFAFGWHTFAELIIEMREVRRAAARERLFRFIDRLHARTKGVPAREIRKVVQEAVEAARRAKRRTPA